MTERKPIDWEWVEREYRAGQLSSREIARQHEVRTGAPLSEAAIRKKAKQFNWSRSLVDQVRKAVREKVVRIDGAQTPSATDEEIVEGAAERGKDVILSQRGDLRLLRTLQGILAARLQKVLAGEDPHGPCLGKNESPGDLLEKLARTTSRIIPLERQAHNLDGGPNEGTLYQLSDEPVSEDQWATTHAG